MRICSVPGCPEKHFGRSYCRTHYERWKRNGDPLFLHRPGGRCAVDGCAVDVWARGYCRTHYRRFMRHGDPLGSAPPPKRADPMERFFSMVEKTGTCWLWSGGISRTGYGNFWVNGGTVSAHRFSYTHLVGLIPAGLDLDHLCRVRRCVNPAHLEAVTEAENNRRMMAHRRASMVKPR
jgi:hypothetical protein